MQSVDSSKPVRFYDDRQRSDCEGFMGRILFETDKVCLCDVDFYQEDPTDDTMLVATEDPTELVLFDKETGEVLTCNLRFWYAENYEPVE